VWLYLQVYLVDYGLATHYKHDGKHRAYKEDPRKAHDGTIEFTSRDAHKGVGKWIKYALLIVKITLPLQSLHGEVTWRYWGIVYCSGLAEDCLGKES